MSNLKHCFKSGTSSYYPKENSLKPELHASYKEIKDIVEKHIPSNQKKKDTVEQLVSKKDFVQVFEFLKLLTNDYTNKKKDVINLNKIVANFLPSFEKMKTDQKKLFQNLNIVTEENEKLKKKIKKMEKKLSRKNKKKSSESESD